MLRCLHTPSPENFPATAYVSVLERQRAMLQRLYHERHHHHSQDTHHSSSSSSSVLQTPTMPVFQYQNLVNSLEPYHSLDDNSQNFGFGFSETTTNTSVSANSSKDQLQVGSTKKRKAEFEVGEEECKKDKRVEGGEAGEVESGITVKSEKENSGRISRENSKGSEVVQKTDYIHVRARRGQATDSHSLAERARREKISKKMKCLQDLVPGCNKVTGKAGMLDEIINYVQSLQKQVEFLSMKLAALNPRLEFGIDNLFAKEIPAYVACLQTTVTPIEIAHSALLQCNQGPQESAGSVLNLAMNSAHQFGQQKTAASPLMFPEAFLDSISSPSQVQQMPNWDSDWQSLFNVGFH